MTPSHRLSAARAGAIFAFLLLPAAAGAAAGDVASVFTGELAPPAEASRHDSGLVTLVLESGEGTQKPDENDMVAVHMLGRTPDGATFQDTYAGGQPAVFEMATVFPAWREAIRMMVQGERRRVWIPASLAPTSNTTGPRGAVVFDVELLGIQSIPDPPADLASPVGAERTSFGALTRVLQPGHGEEHPGKDAAALVHYVGWTKTGKMFDASYLRARPTLLPLWKVMPAMADCVQRMVEGEKRLCWIPDHVGQGQWQGAPPGDLVFHLELIAIGNGSAFVDPGKSAGGPDGSS